MRTLCDVSSLMYCKSVTDLASTTMINALAYNSTEYKLATEQEVHGGDTDDDEEQGVPAGNAPHPGPFYQPKRGIRIKIIRDKLRTLFGEGNVSGS